MVLASLYVYLCFVCYFVVLLCLLFFSQHTDFFCLYKNSSVFGGLGMLRARPLGDANTQDVQRLAVRLVWYFQGQRYGRITPFRSYCVCGGGGGCACVCV